MSELVRRGYNVLVPFGTNQRYDLVLDLDGEFVRVQCKTARIERACVAFSTQSVRSNRHRTFTRGYQGDAELFLVFCRANGCIYAVPVEEAPRGHMYLRVGPTRNGQTEGVRWAKDYELPA